MTPAIAFLASLLVLIVGGKPAGRFGLIDHPGDHKIHRDPVPLLGGVTIYIGLLCAIGYSSTHHAAFAMLTAGAIVLVVGCLDDIRHLPPWTRFVAQGLAMLALIYLGGIQLTDLGTLLFSGSLLALGAWSIPVTVFAGVGVINAVNMTDGVDGLCGVLCGITLTGITVAAVMSKAAPIVDVTATIMAALAAFLLFNLRFPWNQKARVFLGDGGSNLLGVLLAALLIYASQGEHRVMAPVTALWLFAIPLFDTVYVMLHRPFRGRSPIKAHRDHLHHILLRAGFSVNATVGTIALLAAYFCLMGLTGLYVELPENAMFYLFLGHWLLYVLLIEFVRYTDKLFGRTVRDEDDLPHV